MQKKAKDNVLLVLDREKHSTLVLISDHFLSLSLT